MRSVWDAVSFQWKENFRKAEAYYRQYGNLAVSVSYKTEDGFALGTWLNTLRLTHTGKSRNRSLTENQIAQLNAIGMNWQNRQDTHWMREYQAAADYYRTYNNLDVGSNYTTPDGRALGKWVRRQKYAF